MKLQVNTAGAWKDVLTFQAENEAEVREHVARLALLSGGRSTFRIVGGMGVALAHCTPPLFKWEDK